MSRALIPLCIASAAVLAGCSDKGVAAPTDPQVCWHAVPLKGDQIKFNQLAAGVKNLESCAAALEGMRLRFRSFGAGAEEVVGAYQGQYLFLRPEGVFTAQTLTSGRWVLLVRSGDGRLVVPGAMPQTPAPQTPAP